MNIKALANKTYIEYSSLEGSQHIASEHAIFRVLEICKKFKCKNVLELGLGIGTVFAAINKFNPTISYVGTEENEFCLTSLKKNLKNQYKDLKIYKNLTAIDKNNLFDLIIVDGKDSSIKTISNITSKNATLIIEGDRKEQEQLLKKSFPKSIFVHIISIDKNSDKGVANPLDYQGGVKVFFLNPTISQRIYHIKNKISTKLKYSYRIHKN